MTEQQKKKFKERNAKLKAKGERPLTVAEFFRITGVTRFAWKNAPIMPTGYKRPQE